MTGRKAFVVGWPVAHSRSPLIHRFWLDRHGINGEYGREAVPPGEIGSFFGSLADAASSVAMLRCRTRKRRLALAAR
jgi:shikimate dehydrogenase